MKLKLLTSQIKFDIETWSLSQIQIKSWRFDLKLDSSSNLLACQEFELDSSSSSNRNLRLANRVKSTHSSLKFDLTINLFIKAFSKLVKLLIRMIKKKIEFEWTDLVNETFETLKKQMIEISIFRHYDRNRKTILKIDFSD